MLKFSSSLLIIVCLLVNTSQAQNYNNPGGTINTCSGNFYDTGGSSGTYSTAENIVTTFCPTASNKCLSITFTSFDLELNFDELEIYDGPTSSYPLIGSYTGTYSPGVVTAHNGCLTFIFDSDFSINRAGWRANIDCVPCPPPPPCTGTTPVCTFSPSDICANACHLGTLNAPPLCPSTSSSVNVFCLSNIGATPSVPYLYLNGCQPSGGDMASPAADVWYTFIASSNIIDVSITGLSNPNIGLYEGNNCNTFIGRGCAVGAFGNLTATFQPIMAGRKYYLQISGGDTLETSDFTLTITGRNDCDPCVINASLTASPPPLNGVYHGGTTVHFCLTITRWNPTSQNWLHAIVPTFGECWDMSSLVVHPPPSCDNDGSWNWYNSVRSSQTGNIVGPGFFYESTMGCSVCNPNDPGDNYGDYCVGAVNFVFCWDLTVAQCITGNNLNVSVNTYGDGETGSWTSYACAADPVFDFFATYALCSDPVMELKGAACNGAANGRAIAQGQGISPFNFVWRDSLGNILKTSNGRIDFDTLNALPGGRYTIEQTDAVQCFNTIDFIVDEPSPLVNTMTLSPASCNGFNDGSIDITLSGGVPPYEFSIDGINFQSANVFSGLTSGLYTVSSKDDSNCVVTQNASIIEPALLAITLDSIFNSSCLVSNNGAIYITVSGGTLPYSFTWSNVANTEDITNLSGGDYKLTVADTNGCVALDSFSLINNPEISLSISSVNVLCNGGTDGSIDVTVINGTSPFIFSWSNSASSEDLNGIPSGNYTVSVTDANQCPGTATIVITEPPPIILSGSITNLLCNGDSSGAIDLTTSGGVPPFSYAWSNSAITEDITGIAAGNYSVIAADANFCSDTISFTLNQPDAIVLSDIKTDVSCSGGNNGAINLSVSGGILPYQYTWSNNETTEDITGLSAKIYDVVVIDSNLCAATILVTINEPSALTVNGIITDVQCNGENTGAIDLTTSGGVFPYSYHWSNTEITEDLNGITAGVYFVTVSDVNQCSDTLAFAVTEPPTIQLSGTISNPLCNGDNSGAIDVAALGGVPPFSFVWSNSVIAEDITGIAAGNYSVIAIDVNFCSDTTSFTLIEPDTIVLSWVKTDVSCGDGNDGAIDLSVNGGILPYQFTWSNNETTEDVTGLTANVYDVVVIDSNLCPAAASITINEPAALTVSGIITDVLCNGENTGAINIAVSGGVIPYSYQWSNSLTSEDLVSVIADSYSVIVTDSNQCTIDSIFIVTEPPAILLSGNTTNLDCNIDSSGAIDLTASGGVQPFTFLWSNNSIAEDIAGVPAGSYSVIATDDNACSATSSFTLTQPNSITLLLVQTDVNCAGGSDGAINLTVISGTQPFQFTWSNNATTEDLAGLTTGIYDVIVMDSNSCIATSSATIYEPTQLTVNGIATNVLCNGRNTGAIDLTTIGGVAPYSYQWSNTFVNEDLTAISFGNYMVTVSDANQCSDTLAFVVTEPSAIQLNGMETNLHCNGDNSGAIDLNVLGGIQPFSFVWSNNATTEDISGVDAANFFVTATDANSCKATTSFTLTQPDSIELTHALTNVSCAHGTDGAINITVNGGTLPYQFIWSNNAITEDLTGLTAADYDVIVIDFNTCNATASFTITEPAPLNVTGIGTDVLCNGGTGSVNITVNGGVTPYGYQWSNSTYFEDLVAVIADSYSVIVTDANSCTATSAFIVNEPDSLILSGSATDVRCFTSNDGEIQLSALGGTLPYEFSIGALFQTSPSFTNVTGGNYLSEVRDANNCTDSINLTVNTPPSITTAITTDSVSCFGGSDGAASIVASGVNGPFTYRWSDNSSSDSALNLTEGPYYVTVTDNNSCLAYDTATVSQPSQIELTAIVNHPQCNGENRGSVNLNVSGGIPLYTYLWSGNQTTKNVDSLNAGNYFVTVTDNNNCTTSDSYLVTEPSLISLSATAIPVVCNSDSNGIATITASGGTPSYTYQWNAAAGNQTTSSAVNLPAGTYDVVVSDAHGCIATKGAEITEPQLLVAIIDSAADPVCQGESSGFASASATGGTDPVTYLWNNNPAGNSAVITELSSGTYEVTATDGNGCTAAASFILNEPPPLSVTIFPKDTTITYGDSVTLRAVHSPPGISPSYAWEPSTLQLWCVAPCNDPTVAPTESTMMTVYITAQGGNCSASAQAFIDVVFDNDVQMPNAFSPDGDGVNDEFEIFYSPSLSGITYMIFNRWGEKLFETHTLGEFWNGTYRGEPQNPGVYVYWVEGNFLDGEKKQYKGSFTLLR